MSIFYKLLQFQETGQAKGSGGWFAPATVVVEGDQAALAMKKGPAVRIRMWSHRRGEFPPIWVELSLEEARQLGEALIEAAEGATIESCPNCGAREFYLDGCCSYAHCLVCGATLKPKRNCHIENN